MGLGYSLAGTAGIDSGNFVTAAYPILKYEHHCVSVNLGNMDEVVSRGSAILRTIHSKLGWIGGGLTDSLRRDWVMHLQQRLSNTTGRSPQK